MQSIHFSATHEAILEALARCKFLTTGQLMELAIMPRQRANLNREVKKLRDLDQAPIATLTFASHPSRGKLESVHYLTKEGERLLIDHFDYSKERVKRPIGKSTFFYKDYNHRKNTIDLQVALLKEEKAGKGKLIFFDTYFDKIGNNRVSKNLQSKTKIQYSEDEHLIADGIALWRDNQGESALMALEMYNGKDTLRVINSLTQHLKALHEGTLARKVQEQFPEFKKGYKVLCVFEHPSNLKAVWNRMQGIEYFTESSHFFHFKSLDDIQNNGFLNGWIDLNGVEW